MSAAASRKTATKTHNSEAHVCTCVYVSMCARGWVSILHKNRYFVDQKMYKKKTTIDNDFGLGENQRQNDKFFEVKKTLQQIQRKSPGQRNTKTTTKKPQKNTKFSKTEKLKKKTQKKTHLHFAPPCLSMCTCTHTYTPIPTPTQPHAHTRAHARTLALIGGAAGNDDRLLRNEGGQAHEVQIAALVAKRDEVGCRECNTSGCSLATYDWSGMNEIISISFLVSEKIVWHQGWKLVVELSSPQKNR